MKKSIYFLLAAICISTASVAAPGDTTWVQAHNTVQMPGYGNYDTSIAFPSLTGKTYRGIYMIFTLGKYVCPGSPQYCGDWDYTVQNYLIVPGGQSYELGRLITPYANAGAPRTPWGWTQRYVYDVTDYAGLLHDTAKMRIAYSGYSGGFTANIRFAFVEGTPDRDVTGIVKLWGGSWGYGDTSARGARFINVHFPRQTLTAPPYTRSADLKFTVTGHGSDGNGCCEFMSHKYDVVYNTNHIATQTIWRADCGSNELYPQSGTWVFDRANWCPGATVQDYHHDLPGVTAGSSFSVGVEFEPYVGGGSYTTEGTLIYHGEMKKTLDASIDNVIAPTNDENFFRENPICGTPIIRIKNRGAATIDSVTVVYGLKDSVPQQFTWVGTLRTFEEKDITLPVLKDLNTIAGDAAMHIFQVRILTVNGRRDADSTNNKFASRFLAAPRWPNMFRVAMRTNNEPISPGSTVAETDWKIYDMNNNVVAKRDSAALDSLYTDTVKLKTGYYRLVITDGSCDGLSWWLFRQMGFTSGSLIVRRYGSNATIPMNGYSYSGSYAHDFGCGFTQYFYTIDSVHLGITNITAGNVSIEAYPNPAQHTVNVDIAGMEQVSGQLQIIDALGRVVLAQKCAGAHQQIDVEGLANGVYTILFVDEAMSGNKLTTRLLIAK